MKIASIGKGAEQLELSDISGGNSENGTIILENSLTFRVKPMLAQPVHS